MRSFIPGRIPSTRRGLLLALVLLASSGIAFGQQVTVNSTPGLGGANHTVFVYDPYAWAFKGNDIAPVVKKHVAGGGAASGQQYAYTELREGDAPTDDKPAKICTAVTFRDLINKNKNDMGVLVISSHGGDGSVTVEAFASAKKRDEQYDKYTKSPDAKDPPLFTTAEIAKTSNPDGPGISATSKFIEKYRQLNSAFVYIDACEGETLTDAFTKVVTGSEGARVAIGAKGCPGVEGSFKYAQRFFADLDGQPVERRSDDTRLELRAVGPAMTTENKVDKSVQFSISLFGSATTLAPRVREERGGFAFKCPMGKGDTIDLVFDTECEKDKLPDIEVTGITVGDAKWQGDIKFISHELKISVTGPEAPARTFKFTLKGEKLQSGNNQATLDGNTSPALVKEGKGVNAQGPSNSKASPDSYVVEYQDCKRVH